MIREDLVQYLSLIHILQALARPGDVLVGISTSGNSANVVEAVELAKSMGVFCVGMTAEGGGKMKLLCDECIAVPAKVTALSLIHIYFLCIQFFKLFCNVGYRKVSVGMLAK